MTFLIIKQLWTAVCGQWCNLFPVGLHYHAVTLKALGD